MAPHIENALNYGNVSEYKLNDVEQYLETGAWSAIGFFDENSEIHGVITASVIAYPLEKVAFVTAIGGKDLTNDHNMQQLRDICKSVGCSKLQAFSRESVARLWKRVGFNNRAILVETEL